MHSYVVIWFPFFFLNPKKLLRLSYPIWFFEHARMKICVNFILIKYLLYEFYEGNYSNYLFLNFNITGIMYLHLFSRSPLNWRCCFTGASWSLCQKYSTWLFIIVFIWITRLASWLTFLGNFLANFITL